MRPIGGEIEVNLQNSIIYTDSGRSSLRLFIKNIKPKKILIPDFLCKVIISVLEDEKIDFSFYHINEDLTIDYKSVKEQEFDIFYLINYFGVVQNLENIQQLIIDKIIIEDNVFFYNFNNRGFKNWYAFNSYRKISILSDGSIIKTNLSINTGFIENINLFAHIKYDAKQKKYNYLKFGNGNESSYLELFEKGEALLDNQKVIGKISDNSIYLLSIYDYSKIQQIRKYRFNLLYRIFQDYVLNKKAIEYSYLVLKLNNRDKIREKLFKQNIFLPIHWPKVTNNSIYDKVLSIPLFENYTDNEFENLISTLKRVIYDNK